MYCFQRSGRYRYLLVVLSQSLMILLMTMCYKLKKYWQNRFWIVFSIEGWLYDLLYRLDVFFFVQGRIKIRWLWGNRVVCVWFFACWFIIFIFGSWWFWVRPWWGDRCGEGGGCLREGFLGWVGFCRRGWPYDLSIVVESLDIYLFVDFDIWYLMEIEFWFQPLTMTIGLVIGLSL